MVWKRARVVWKGQKATRHILRSTLQNANFNRIDLPSDTIHWSLHNESTTNFLDVSFQSNADIVRADFTFFQLDNGPQSIVSEESRPSALFVRRNVANQPYYFEAITLGWTEEEDEDA